MRLVWDRLIVIVVPRRASTIAAVRRYASPPGAGRNRLASRAIDPARKPRLKAPQTALATGGAT